MPFKVRGMRGGGGGRTVFGRAAVAPRGGEAKFFDRNEAVIVEQRCVAVVK